MGTLCGGSRQCEGSIIHEPVEQLMTTGLGLVRPGKEPGVKLNLLDGREVLMSSRLADEAGEAVAEGAVAREEVTAPFAFQGKEMPVVGSCL